MREFQAEGFLMAAVNVPPSILAMTLPHYGAEMREEILARIADETGGRFYHADDVAGLADEMPLSRSGISVQERLALWDMPVIFLLLVGMLAFEWLYRRWRGLV